MNFQTAAVIGTGTMGPGIASTLALGGVSTVILSRNAASAQDALQRARQYAGEHAHLLSASTDLDAAVPGVDLVVESAPEDMAFKKELFAHLDAIAKPDAVLATNTSGLSITQIQSACKLPGRVLTTHFWNPPQYMPLVEIVKGEQTSQEVADAIRELLLRCGKVPVMVKKDRPGQLGNRMQAALQREAINIVAQGIADPEEVDLAVKMGFGMRLPVYGVFEHIDMVGLDLARAVIDYATKDLYNEPQAPPLMAEKIARGELGVKSGKGFYDWTVKDPAEVRARRDAFIRQMTGK
jgi:3-hydroxybutyryl-CoA dehydrogenase